MSAASAVTDETYGTYGTYVMGPISPMCLVGPIYVRQVEARRTPRDAGVERRLPLKTEWEISTLNAALPFMNKMLVGRLLRQGLWFAACLALVAANHVSAGTTADRPESQFYQLPLPLYRDSTPWGKYFRQLQDTVATRWYEEITYYTHRYEYNWGTVTARYTVTPDGSFHNQQILSNTCGPAMPSAVIRSIRNTWIQPFPAAVASIAPGGLVVEQTFRYWDYDGTNYGLASSYPQLLVNRAPEIGGGQYLNLRKFFDLTRFRFQSRILEATPVNSRLAAR